MKVKEGILEGASHHFGYTLLVRHKSINPAHTQGDGIILLQGHGYLEARTDGGHLVAVVQSDSLHPHGLQHAKSPFPSLALGVYSKSNPGAHLRGCPKQPPKKEMRCVYSPFPFLLSSPCKE